MWRKEADLLRPWARVIAPDLAGFGKAPRRPGGTVAEMAQAAAAELDQLQVKEPVVLAGLSMGGYVAFEFLRQFPQRVRGLGLFSTRAAADTAEGRQGRFKAIEQIEKSGMGPFAKAILPKLLGETTRTSNPALTEEVAAQVESADPGGVADALRAMAGRRDSTDLLAGVSCPTLVVAGEEDAFIPVSEARALAQKIPGARLEVIPQAGHLVNLEQPARFQEILATFLHRLAAEPAA